MSASGHFERVAPRWRTRGDFITLVQLGPGMAGIRVGELAFSEDWEALGRHAGAMLERTPVASLCVDLRALYVLHPEHQAAIAAVGRTLSPPCVRSAILLGNHTAARDLHRFLEPTATPDTRFCFVPDAAESWLGSSAPTPVRSHLAAFLSGGL